MELRNINSFLKVASLNSFSKAAAALGYSQSNVTMQIKQLETELNTTLFDRIGKSIRLTEQGKVFLKYALTISTAVNDAKQEVSHSHIPSGELRIGILESLCITYLPDIIKEYHMHFPNVTTIIKTGTYEELSSMLNSNTIDILWTFDHKITHHEWIKEIEYSNEIHMIASKTHPVFQKADLSLSDLSNELFILTEQDCSYRKTFEELLASNEIPYQTFMEIGNTEIIKKFVSSGLCLSVLPSFAITKEVEANELQTLDIKDFHLEMYGQVFHHKNKSITGAMQEFITLLEQSILLAKHSAPNAFTK